MAELITQRIQRNAGELRLHAIAENPDELIERADAAQLGYRESSTCSWNPKKRKRGRRQEQPRCDDSPAGGVRWCR